ncbi:MAG: hypothetical protein ACWGSQ_06380, partial [Longimicrobiales bacterium]
CVCRRGIFLAGSVGSAHTGLAAQELPETRVLAVVDFVAGGDLYLAVGTDHGVRPSDTLSVYDGEGEGAALLGRFHILSATGKRSVANILGEAFPLDRGSLVYLGIPGERLAEMADAAPVTAGVGLVAGGEGQPQGNEVRTPSPPLRLHGRVSLDFDAFRTVTRWGEDSGEEEVRSFSTPTFRLQGRGQNLPGGFNLGTGIRISHRMSSDDLVQPITSTRFYQLDLEKRFDRVPLEMHLGRFSSPYDEFSGYWDGLLLRVGPRGLGAGVAVGFEPRWSNEGFGSERPKLSGFVDFDARGERLAYSGAMTFLGIRPRNALPDRTALGFSQRFRMGRAWIYNRVEVDRDPGGSEWNLTRLQLDGSVTLVGGLGAFGGWRRWRSLPLWDPDPAAGLGPQENRGHIGLSYWGRSGGGSVDLSVNRPEEGEGGQTLSGSLYLTRTPIPGVGVGASASRWSRGEETSLLLSPELRLAVGPLSLRGTYRYYNTVRYAREERTHFTDASLTVPLGGSGIYLRVLGSTQWGGDLSSNRIYASIWKGF